ncbi:phosphate acyltransferase PlsX, partial [bacterium]|nr:phosphate acyltransferase PlsX [bacterium]
MSPTIAVDAMGGDRGPSTIIPAVLEVSEEHKEIKIVLVGRKRDIVPFFSDGKIPESITIMEAEDVIYDSDDPVLAYKEKPDSSLHIGLELLKDRHADAFFTTGNTGATVLAAHFICDYLPGVTRSALATIFPTLSGRELFLLDLGATMEQKPELLADFARLGAAFCQVVTGNSTPVVKLLNIGTESEKGPKHLQKTARILEKELHFGGFIEGNHLFRFPNADVVVMDGFTGNILLKTMEGLAKTIQEMVKKHTEGSGPFGFTRRLIDKKIHSMTNRFNYTMYGTAILLGVEQLIGIGHGRSEKT